MKHDQISCVTITFSVLKSISVPLAVCAECLQHVVQLMTIFQYCLCFIFCHVFSSVPVNWALSATVCLTPIKCQIWIHTTYVWIHEWDCWLLLVTETPLRPNLFPLTSNLNVKRDCIFSYSNLHLKAFVTA